MPRSCSRANPATSGSHRQAISAPSCVPMRAAGSPRHGIRTRRSTSESTSRTAQTHQVALYCLDWDSNARSQRIEVLNSVTGAVLDTRTINAFNGGQYLVYNINGAVTVRFTRVAGFNAVVSGIFFGGQLDHARSLTTPANGASYRGSGQRRPERHARRPRRGRSGKVEFFQGTTKLGEDLSVAVQPDRGRTSPAGAYSLDGESHRTAAGGDSAPRTAVQIMVAAGYCRGDVGHARIRLRKVTGAGRMAGMVSQWSAIPPATRRTPRWFRAGTSPGCWETVDQRYPSVATFGRQRPRMRHAWNASTPFNVGVNVLDGQFHQLAIYCVDWDSTERVQRVDVLNARDRCGLGHAHGRARSTADSGWCGTSRAASPCASRLLPASTA